MSEPPYQEPAPDDDGDGSAAGPEVEVFRDASVVVVRQDRVDYGECDELGYWDYIYCYASYRIQAADRTYGARRYAEEWRRVSVSLPFSSPSVPYDDPGFCAAVRYFAEAEGLAAIDAFVGGAYVPVDPSRARSVAAITSAEDRGGTSRKKGRRR